MNKIGMVKRVWGICAPFRRHLAGSLGIVLVFQAINSVFPLIMGMLVTAVVEKQKTALVWTIAVWFVLITIRTGIGYLRDFYEVRNLSYEFPRYLSKISMEKFFNISMGQHHLGHSLIKSSVVRKGEAAISGIVSSVIYDLLPLILMIMIPLMFMIVRVPLVGTCVSVTISIFIWYSYKFNNSFVPKLRVLDTLANTVSKKHGEVIQNADVVYVNAQEERVKVECDDGNVLQGTQGKPVWLSYVAWFFGGLWFTQLSQVVCIAISAYLAFRGKISSGTFVALSMWIGMSLGMLWNISNMQRNMAKNMAPISKYFKFLDYEPDILMPKNPVPIEHLRGRIEFRHVSFTYRSRATKDDLDNDDEEGQTDGVNIDTEKVSEIPALRDVSFVLEEGKRHAFVGKSGAGKSTLVGLILRAFDPQSGHVLVDGVDVRVLDYKDLRRKIGLVPQDVAMFDGTMRYNVTFGMNGSALKVTDAELEAAANLARVSEFKEKLEKGWETLIGERGIKLSGGQRQRVGIMRALIKNPHILIFDEATSSLDMENESGIRESIVEASAGKTAIIIAHRLATVKDADKIFVFDDGRIVGEGTHDELLRSNDYYQRLVQSQVIMA